MLDQNEARPAPVEQWWYRPPGRHSVAHVYSPKADGDTMYVAVCGHRTPVGGLTLSMTRAKCDRCRWIVAEQREAAVGGAA